jgi:hypothetical protein
LIGLSLITSWKNVLEYGSGLLSTPTFSNRKIFKDVEKVISYENSNEWYQQINASLLEDRCLELRLVEGSMSKYVKLDEVSNADLIFIDDSSACSERVQTIKRVIKYKPKCVLIHDFEVFRYRLAARGMANCYIFKSLVPNTGLLWEGHLIDKKSIVLIDCIIKKHLNQISLDDIEAWKNTFSIEMRI